MAEKFHLTYDEDSGKFSLHCGTIFIDSYDTMEQAEADVHYWTCRVLEVCLGIGLPAPADSFLRKLAIEWYNLTQGQ